MFRLIREWIWSRRHKESEEIAREELQEKLAMINRVHQALVDTRKNN